MKTVAQDHWYVSPQIPMIFDKTETVEVKWHYPQPLRIEFLSGAFWTCRLTLPQAETHSKFKALSGRVSFNNTHSYTGNTGFPGIIKWERTQKDLNKKVLVALLQITQMPTNRRMEDKLWHIYTMEYYTAIKKSKFLKHVTTWTSQSCWEKEATHKKSRVPESARII